MKLAKLNRRLGTVSVAAALLLLGCDSGGEDTSGSSTEPGTSTDDTTADTTADTTDGSTGTTTSDDGSSGGPTGADESSTTGPPPAGLGCGDPPPCDKGEFVGSIRIESADQIEEIAGYTSMTGWLEVYQSDLTCLDFLGCMENVGHDVTIFGNEFLTDVEGTNAMVNLGVATEELDEADKDGTLVVSENAMLEDISGFNALEQVQANLLISENASLTSISGFDTLVGVRKNFQVRFNEVLTSIASNGLRGILFIGGECVATNNSSLCISTIESICGDLDQGPAGGSTVNNDNGC